MVTAAEVKAIAASDSSNDAKLAALHLLQARHPRAFCWELHNELRHLYAGRDERASMAFCDGILERSPDDGYILSILSDWKLAEDAEAATAALESKADRYPDLPHLVAACLRKARSLREDGGERSAADGADALEQVPADQANRPFEASCASAEPPGPQYDYPGEDQQLDLEGDYLFQVVEVPGASGYLWGFFQGGKMVWENYRDERELSGRSYAIMAGSLGWKKLKAGEVEVWCRAYVNDQWTAATIIKVLLRSRE